MNDVAAAIAEIKELEARRCRALVGRDLATLASLVCDELVHIHATGKIDDRVAYLSGIENTFDFLKVERSELLVRIYGPTAVATGELNQTIRMRESGIEHVTKAATTQVWLKSGGSWRQVSFHACFVRQAAP